MNNRPDNPNTPERPKKPAPGGSPDRPDKAVKEIFDQLEKLQDYVTDLITEAGSHVSDVQNHIRYQSKKPDEIKTLTEAAQKSIQKAQKQIDEYEKAIKKSILTSEDKNHLIDLLSTDKYSLNEHARKLNETLGISKVNRPSSHVPTTGSTLFNQHKPDKTIDDTPPSRPSTPYIKKK